MVASGVENVDVVITAPSLFMLSYGATRKNSNRINVVVFVDVVHSGNSSITFRCLSARGSSSKR